MGALFEIFATLLMALATAAFAHLGVAWEGDGSRARGEPSRVVKRSPVPAGSEPALFAVVRR